MADEVEDAVDPKEDPGLDGCRSAEDIGGREAKADTDGDRSVLDEKGACDETVYRGKGKTEQDGGTERQDD